MGHRPTDQLREIVASRGLSAHGLGKLAGVPANVCLRFLKGEGGVNSETFDRICAALGLRLVEVAMSRKRKPTGG